MILYKHIPVLEKPQMPLNAAFQASVISRESQTFILPHPTKQHHISAHVSRPTHLSVQEENSITSFEMLSSWNAHLLLQEPTNHTFASEWIHSGSRACVRLGWPL